MKTYNAETAGVVENRSAPREFDAAALDLAAKMGCRAALDFCGFLLSVVTRREERSSTYGSTQNTAEAWTVIDAIDRALGRE